MIDPEVLFAHRERTKQIKAEIERMFGAEVRAAEAAEAQARKRAIAIVKKGSDISGVPETWGCYRTGSVEITPDRVNVSIELYCGEGEWEHEHYIRFPPRWLGMPDADWMAELSAECERIRQVHAAAIARIEAAFAAEEKREREEL